MSLVRALCDLYAVWPAALSRLLRHKAMRAVQPSESAIQPSESANQVSFLSQPSEVSPSSRRAAGYRALWHARLSGCSVPTSTEPRPSDESAVQVSHPSQVSECLLLFACCSVPCAVQCDSAGWLVEEWGEVASKST